LGLGFGFVFTGLCLIATFAIIFLLIKENF
jgi:hypothetical protein